MGSAACCDTVGREERAATGGDCGKGAIRDWGFVAGSALVARDGGGRLTLLNDSHAQRMPAMAAAQTISRVLRIGWIRLRPDLTVWFWPWRVKHRIGGASGRHVPAS